jgi:hypothetical protein
MSKGILLIAHDSAEMSYVNMAILSAKRVTQYLKLPTTLITDSVSAEGKDISVFDKVILIDLDNNTNVRTMYQGNEVVKTNWNNGSRTKAYELSPYNETILLDTDYVINSDILLNLFKSNKDFLCHNNVIDVTDRNGFDGCKVFGNKNMPMYWATVMYWKKDTIAHSIFTVMDMVQKNYSHYASIYGFADRPYRNDYALSIAMYTLAGHTAPTAFIPWQLATTNVDVEVIIDKNTANLSYVNNTQPKYLTIKDLDLHVMNKKFTWQS